MKSWHEYIAFIALFSLGLAGLILHVDSSAYVAGALLVVALSK